MGIMAPQWMLNRFGSKKGFLKHFSALFLYALGVRFGTNSYQPKEVKRVVYVCKGNICRSALAAALTDSGASIEVESFGLKTTDGNPANKLFMELAKKNGVCLKDHRTKSIESFVGQEGDLYVCMEPWQSSALRKKMPGANITLLGLHGLSIRPYIHDPYSANTHYKVSCISFIEVSVDRLLEKIVMAK